MGGSSESPPNQDTHPILFATSLGHIKDVFNRQCSLHVLYRCYNRAKTQGVVEGENEQRTNDPA